MGSQLGVYVVRDHAEGSRLTEELKSDLELHGRYLVSDGPISRFCP